MEYKIITSETFFGVERQVNKYLRADEGWSIHGGVCFVSGMTGQAMTRTQKKPKTPVKRFVKPTKAELLAHKADKGLKFDVDAFIDFYESCGWKVGNKPMKSWSHAVSNWCRNNKSFSPTAKADSRVNTNQPKAFVPEVVDESRKLTKEQIRAKMANSQSKLI